MGGIVRDWVENDWENYPLVFIVGVILKYVIEYVANKNNKKK